MRSRLRDARPRSLAVAAGLVLAFSVTHALLELVARISIAVDGPRLQVAIGLTLVFLPLHLRHLWFGMRAGRPPRAGLTLSVMVIAELIGLVVVGPSWTLMLAALGTSALIVLAPPWSFAAVAACVLWPMASYGVIGAHGLFGQYQVSSLGDAFDLGYIVLFLALGQFALVWLLAAVRQLELSRGALAVAAAEDERARVQQRIGSSLGRCLDGLLVTGREARGAIDETGLAVPLIAVDRLLSLAHAALADLRRVVADARTPAGASAAAGLAQAARDARTPVGRALTVRRARRACWLLYWLWFLFAPLFALGLLGALPVSTPVAVVLIGSVAMAGLQGWLLVEVMRGARPRFAAARWWLMLALWAGVLPVAGYAWENLGCFVAAGAALSFRGWRRVLPTLVIAVTVVVYEIVAFLPHFPGFTSFDWAMEIIGQLYLYVYVSAALAASAALVTTVRRLDRVRDQLTEHAATAERRRLSSDLHDILGQSLTAIALKTGLARELAIAGDRAAARVELADVLAVAQAQATEIDAVTRNQRRVQLKAELQEAVELLRTAEIEVTVTDDLDDLDEDASSVLGLALREGTTNILRHAHARRCEIALRRRDGQIHLELRNDGAHGARGNGTGLAGLRERLTAAQGSAHAEALPGGRFELRVELPE